MKNKWKRTRKKGITNSFLNLPEKKIIALYEKYNSTTEIAKKYNCYRGTILGLLKRNNIKIRPNSIPRRDLPKEKIIQLYEKCRSSEEIAKKYNCDAGSILRLLRRNNIEIRPRYSTKKGIEKMKKTFIKIGRGWTKKQIKFLKNNYKTKITKDLAKVIKKNVRTITAKANSLGLYKPEGFHSKKVSGKNNYMYGRKLSISSIKKIIKNHADVSGNKNPNWRGGISYDPYDLNWTPKFKRTIRKRDNQVCMLCGIHREKLNRAFDVHHINYDKKLSIPQNCISLCKLCHNKTNGNREHWTKFFQSLLSEKYGYQYSKEEEVIINLKNE